MESGEKEKWKWKRIMKGGAEGKMHNKTGSSRRKRNRELISILLTCAMLLTFLGGCGKQNTGGSTGSTAGNSSAGTETSQGGAGTSTQKEQSADASAMGRYVEETTDMADQISGYQNKLFQLENGSLILYDGNKPLQVSKDNGATWEAENTEWLTKMDQEGIYIADINIGADGTTVIEHDGGIEDDFIPHVLIVKPDGTEIPVEMPCPDDELFMVEAAVSDDGRVFLSIGGTDTLYEVSDEGRCESFLTIQEGTPRLMKFQGNLLMMDGFGYKAPLIYDIEKKEYIEDEVLENFVKENYPGGNSYSVDDGYELYFFAGEENVIYLAGKKGLHRHVIGGSAIEQVIDGSLCTFSNPAYRIEGMVMLDNNEFLALFNGARLIRYVYDPDIPTVPNERLTVYSLMENKTIRQAVSLYQSANPAVYVEYKTGMAEGSSVTREDALKTLNTEIMAGQGPDVLILDDMPIDSYVEKGMLLDLAPLLGSLSGEEALFTNLVDAMKTGDAVYAMPCEVEIPVVMGEETYISDMQDLKGIADAMERLRQDNPGNDILRICTEKGIMRFFSMVCAPAWIRENGELDKEAVAEFLKQAKRIYDAQMDGLDTSYTKKYDEFNESWLAEYGETRDDSRYLRTGESVMEYVAGRSRLARSALDGRDMFSYFISANRVKGYEDHVWRKMDGQSSNVFCAVTLLGINAASAYTEQAQDFVRLCLGKENQNGLFYGFAVNKAAFAEVFTPDADRLDADGAYLWSMSSFEDGTMLEFVSYWPNEEETAALRACIETADTPYMENTVIEGVVYAEGEDYLQGQQSLEEAVAEIEKRIALYMAE